MSSKNCAFEKEEFFGTTKASFVSFGIFEGQDQRIIKFNAHVDFTKLKKKAKGHLGQKKLTRIRHHSFEFVASR